MDGLRLNPKNYQWEISTKEEPLVQRLSLRGVDSSESKEQALF